MTNSTTRQLIGIAISTLRELRAGCISTSPAGDGDAVDGLREAGFAGGPAVYEAFEQWLGESNTLPNAAELTVEEFGDRAARYFRDAGWGQVDFDSASEEGVAVISMDDCWEAERGSASSPSCHITTGMLASFFGKLAGYPVAVMETECRSADGARCRFLLGNAELMAFKWEQIRLSD